MENNIYFKQIFIIFSYSALSYVTLLAKMFYILVRQNIYLYDRCFSNPLYICETALYFYG